MELNLIASLNMMFKHEGGYVNNPHDPGGITNLGVTKKVWEEWVGHTVTADDMRALTTSMVAPLYKKNYWDKIRGDDLPTGVDYMVFDFCVNSGPSRAAKTLQRVVGTTDDGKIGPMTIATVKSYLDLNGKTRLVDDYCNARLNFLKGLRTWPHFGRGWSNRVEEVRNVAKGNLG